LSLVLVLAMLLSACAAVSPVQTAPPSERAVAPQTEPVSLRLSVSLTPQELASFQAALDTVAAAHPEWNIALETIPQQGIVEKLNAQLAADDLPDLIRLPGIQAQRWIRRGAFLDLTPLIAESDVDLADFYAGPLEQFRWNDALWGLPDTAAPEIVFYNRTMFDAAGLPFPTDDWTFEEMREAAVLLTLDAAGRNPTEPDFDPESIVQWGWNGGLTYFWQRHLVRPFGGDFCANADCTQMIFTAPDTVEAVAWWADFTHDDHATLYDPYGGSQTGVPGDPFIAGKAAMGYNGFFAVGQLNDTDAIDYGIVQPFVGEDGQRYTPVSTNGYLIAANSEHPEAAWALMQALTAPDFLAETWGRPGHAVPARRSVGDAVINPARSPANQAAIVAAVAYGEVFKPYTASAFEVYGKTADLFVQIMKGELPVDEGLAQIERTANEILAADRNAP
jgi:multiple sugar transport system substrate-binding protein